MTTVIRPVTIKQLPGRLSMRQRRLFFRDLLKCMDGERPRIVLDCGTLLKCDRGVVLLLLRCLEEAIKRNGDVKLAALAPSVKEMLESTRARRLFEVFETTADAVESFHRGGIHVTSAAFLSEHLQGAKGSAA